MFLLVVFFLSKKDGGTDMQEVIKVEQLSKTYGNLLAVDKINLSEGRPLSPFPKGWCSVSGM